MPRNRAGSCRSVFEAPVEPLILEYDVTEWMNKSYRGSDNDRRCMPELKDSYRGYVRISTAFFDGGYDIDDSTNKEE